MNLSDIIRDARALPREQFERIASGFGELRGDESNFERATLKTADGVWAVCRAPAVSSEFRLLDATVRQRLAEGVVGGVAILSPPEPLHGSPAPEGYRRRYQEIAWNAFRVVWLDESAPAAFAADAPRPRGQFDAIVDAVAAQCSEGVAGARPTKSREAEVPVRDLVGAALSALGFTYTPSTAYRGFWRRPMADGVWRRGGTDAPLSIGLEVKLDEDQANPLCQAVEVLGEVDAMFYVTVPRHSPKHGAVHPLVAKAKELLQRHAPMRYLECPFHG